jgi:hypothetical protein
VGVRLSDSDIALQVINFEQNWHRLSLYLSEGGIGRFATREATKKRFRNLLETLDDETER